MARRSSGNAGVTAAAPAAPRPRLSPADWAAEKAGELRAKLEAFIQDPGRETESAVFRAQSAYGRAFTRLVVDAVRTQYGDEEAAKAERYRDGYRTPDQQAWMKAHAAEVKRWGLPKRQETEAEYLARVEILKQSAAEDEEEDVGEAEEEFGEDEE